MFNLSTATLDTYYVLVANAANRAYLAGVPHGVYTRTLYHIECELIRRHRLSI